MRIPGMQVNLCGKNYDDIDGIADIPKMHVI